MLCYLLYIVYLHEEQKHAGSNPKGQKHFFSIGKNQSTAAWFEFFSLSTSFSYLTCRASAAKTLKCFLLVIEKWALQVSLCSHLCIPY